jgi:opacity protein-like surface antigen
MNKLVAVAALLLVLAPGALAQSDDYHKVEFFGGYSTMNFDNAAGNSNNAEVNEVFGEKEGLRGFNTSLTANFNKYFGAKFDYSLHLREDNFSRPLGSGTIDTSLQNFLGGVQIKNNVKDGPRFKPFGHALIGVAVQKIDVDSPQLPAVFGVNDFSVNETSLAFALGGGLDIRVTDRIDARLGQIDWNIIRRGDQQIQGTTPGRTIILPNTRQDNLRFSIGIVIH